MEDNKYYTPTIEEFHVGFEYEENSITGISWVKRNLTSKIIEHEINHFGTNKYRVKYLDKEDIESLINNIESISEFHGDTIEVKFKSKNEREDNLTSVIILYNTKSKWMLISQNLANYINRFAGYIKNKSELKVLLKQLDII